MRNLRTVVAVHDIGFVVVDYNYTARHEEEGE